MTIDVDKMAEVIAEFLTTYKGDANNLGIGGKSDLGGNVLISGPKVIPTRVMADFVAKRMNDASGAVTSNTQ